MFKFIQGCFNTQEGPEFCLLSVNWIPVKQKAGGGMVFKSRSEWEIIGHLLLVTGFTQRKDKLIYLKYCPPFLNRSIADVYLCNILYAMVVWYSDSQFLEIMLYLQLL